jgi:hypothetical protein
MVFRLDDGHPDKQTRQTTKDLCGTRKYPYLLVKLNAIMEQLSQASL